MPKEELKKETAFQVPFVEVSFAQLSEWGLVVEINEKVLHPRGLALFYEQDTLVSRGAYIDDKDLCWDYDPAFREDHRRRLEAFDADRVRILTSIVTAKRKEQGNKKEEMIYAIKYMTSGGLSASLHDYMKLPGGTDKAQLQRALANLLMTENAGIVGIVVYAQQGDVSSCVAAMFRHYSPQEHEDFSDPFAGMEIPISDVQSYWEANYVRTAQPQISSNKEMEDQIKTLLELVKSLEEDNAKLRLWNGPVTCASGGTGEKPPEQDLGKSFAGAAS